jgi:hypothetical protein
VGLWIFVFCIFSGWLFCRQFFLPFLMRSKELPVELLPVGISGGIVAAIVARVVFPPVTILEATGAGMAGICIFLLIASAFAKPMEANPRIVKFRRRSSSSWA